jgi:ABC-type dipeptide/oligopeptide/nickel transport system ATPase subunit
LLEQVDMRSTRRLPTALSGGQQRLSIAPPGERPAILVTDDQLAVWIRQPQAVVDIFEKLVRQKTIFLVARQGYCKTGRNDHPVDGEIVEKEIVHA